MDVDDNINSANAGRNPRITVQLRKLVAAMSNSVALRGLAGLLAGAAVLLLPTVTTALVTFILIAFLAFSGITDLFYAVTGRRWFGRRLSRWLAVPRGLAATIIAALLGFLAYAGTTELTLTFAVSLVGIYVGIRGVMSLVSAFLNRRTKDPLPPAAGGSLAVILGVLAAFVPASLVSSVIVAAATASLVVGLILVSWSLRNNVRRSKLDPETASIPELVWDWIENSDIGRKERAVQAGTLYLEQPQRLTKMGTWWIMLVLSVAIATFAVLADSTAVIIGAMLVAPLMTPILGLAGALVNGWGRRAFESAALVVLGAVVSIALAYGLAAWAPVAIAYSTNSQIVSRVSPNIVDMLIALAAGAAGAFATVNARVASGIAGVAIAVALVPPLAVVGVCLYGARFEDAGGATLLFLTNFVAIVLAAATVFVLTGFARPYALRNRPRQLIKTMGPFVALAGIILLPLMLTSEGLLQSQTRERDAQNTVEDWLGDDTEFVISAVDVAGNDVDVTITGPGDPPSANDLYDAMQQDFVDPITLELTVVPVEITVIPTPTPTPTQTPTPTPTPTPTS
ncbi:DUF389 domain-containing protein [Microbacterium marmarense]|uniref:DUF389 domain-containing protein n=1 Tax=Microbacterium marmarense TaxID=3122051 RepID=A0ABU8LS86_9MICO